MNERPPSVSPSREPASGPGRGWLHRVWQGFWLAFLVVSLAYAWYCFYVPSNRIAWADSYPSAQQQAAASDKPAVLFFTGTWCVPCRIMKRNVWADDQVAEVVNAGFVAVTIDVGDSDADAALRQYGIRATPTTIITDPQGTVLQHREGGIGKAEFLDLLGLVGRQE